MPLNLDKNIDYIRQANEWTPDLGAKLAELLSAHSQGITNVAQQTNANPQGPPQPPPNINSLNVSAQNGQFTAQINHQGAEFYRGVHYFLVHSDNAQFTNPHTVHLGTTRNWASGNWGNAKRYFAAFAQYPGSDPTPLTYHGDASAPKLVTGGGSTPGPDFGASQGSGTGDPGVAHSGFGPVPYRSLSGKPPQR